MQEDREEAPAGDAELLPNKTLEIEAPGQQPEVQMSKSQMKKLARRQRMLEKRPERRKQEKERKKQRRKELARLAEEEGLDKSSLLNVRKTKSMSESDNKFKVVIDMDFESYMTDDEIGKAAKQVGRIYSINRHSDRPCQLYLTSLRGRISERFSITNAGFKNWDMNISETDYLGTLKLSESDVNKCHLIYLSGDSDETLPLDTAELLKDESSIFIIGGLVDHNRHKNLCFERAQERNIRTARLPIKEANVQMCQRHILSTVTVFEILLNVLGSRMSWHDALLASIPQRKIAPTKTNLVDSIKNKVT